MSGGPLTLGTGGHIDHGKTRLIEALTGTNTDRLPEERERGISIALGYAQLELPSGRRLSVVDVPGHERFVRTMIAGATGIDLFLLVVDAGEGPKAQTHEHVEILRLLGLERGVIALTKIDAVDDDRAAAAEKAAGRLLPTAEIVRVSAVTGEGLSDLLAALERAADTVERRPRDAPTRLYVDRVFSLPGAGVVVTGTLWSGAIGAGDRLEVLPAGIEVRVRSVEVHGTAVARAEAGQRVALAVSTERRRRIARGDALVAPGAYAPSYRLDVTLDPPGAVADGMRVQVCHATSSVAARVVAVGPGHAQLRLERQLVAARGDRLVLRRETTLGGARVLDPAPPRRVDPERMRSFDTGDPRAVLTALVDAPVLVADVRVRASLTEGELAAAGDGFVRAGPWICSAAWLAATAARANASLAALEDAVDPGRPVSALLGTEPWASAIAPLLGLETAAGKLYLPGRRPSAGSRGREIEAQLAAAGLEPVPVADGELAAQLEREGRLVRLGDGLAIGPDAYALAKAALVEECERVGSISLARFRDLLGSSRRVAQLLLERFDTDRITLRVGDARRLRRSAASG